MGNSIDARNDAVNGVAQGANANWVGLHTSDPGTGGSGELTGGSYQRVAVTFPPATSGASTSTTAVLSIPPGAVITHWSRWKQQSGGSFYQGFELPAQEQFASGGTYSIAIQIQQPAGVVIT